MEMCFNAESADAVFILAGKSISGQRLNTVSHMLGAAIKLYS